MARFLTSQKTWLVTLLLLLGASTAWLFLEGQETSQPESPSRVMSIGEGVWRIIEVADTPEKRTQGLADRAMLEPGTGMLFVFPYKDKYGFWMKGMQFPLDIIFLRDGVVDSIARHRLPGDLTSVFPEHPIDEVLEVNAGEGVGVEPGQQVTWQ